MTKVAGLIKVGWISNHESLQYADLQYISIFGMCDLRFEM